MVKLKWIHNDFFFFIYLTVHLVSFIDFYYREYNTIFRLMKIVSVAFRTVPFAVNFGNFIYSATWPYLLCTQHTALLLVSLHPGPLLFLLCLTRCQSVSKTSEISFHTQST